MFMLVFFLHYTVPYQEITTLQTLPLSGSGGQHYLCKIADDRQQTRCGEHNATTLLHSSSGR